jgi:hypothetical protein
MISTLKVLNTVTLLGTDVSVGADGILNIANGAVADAYNVGNVVINTSVSENAGVITITPTAVASTLYTFYIAGFSKSTGTPKTLSVSFTSAASTDATAISNQAKAIISGTSYDPDFSVTANAAGTGTIVLTAAAGYPFFTVGGTTASITSISGTGATTIFTNISAANGTTGRIGAGLGSSLQAKYAYAAAGNALIYNELANLVPTSYYTEVVIDYLGTGYSGSSAFRGEISTNQAVVLVLFGTSAQGTGAASTATTSYYTDLLGTYGTITGLQAGYRVVMSSSTPTAASIAATTGAITFVGSGTTTSPAGLGLQSGDYLAIGSNFALNTMAVTKITGVVANAFGAVVAYGTNVTSVSQDEFKYAAWRPLPL